MRVHSDMDRGEREGEEGREGEGMREGEEKVKTLDRIMCRSMR